MSRATWSRRSISPSDSTLKQRIPAASAAPAGGAPARAAAPGDDIEAGAQPGKQVEDGEVRIGLDRVADQHVAPGAARHEFVPHALQGCPRVYVAGCAELLRDSFERYRLDAQRPVAA